MQRRSWLVLLAVAVVGAAGLALWNGTNGAASTRSAPQPSVQASRPTMRSAAAPAPTLVNELPSVAEPTVGRAEAAASVRRDQVTVTVNGVAITGRQLVAFVAGSGDEQTMTREMFEYLRNRAIDRELTFQAARKHGVALTPAQDAELEQMRKRSTQRDAADVELEIEDARAGLLQSALLARTGATQPTPADADPATRQRLADEAQAQYAQRLRTYLDELRANAKIAN